MNPFALSTLNLASSIYQDPEEALIATAQAVLETGSGKSVPGGNLFGIKGPGSTHRTWEVVNGQPVTTTASFREYGSPEESIAGRMEFLRSNPRYGKAGYFDATTAEEKADALQRAGYATDPNYAAKLKSIVSDLRGSSVQTFPYQAPGMPSPAPAPEPRTMRPTIRYADIFSGLQGRPGADPLAQAAFAMADVMAPPGQRTGAAREFVMGDRQSIATQIQLARLMQEEERLAYERQAREALASGLSPTAAAAVRAGINPSSLGLIEEAPEPTSAQRNYEYLISQGVPESEARGVFRTGTTIQNFPSLPSGYRLADPNDPSSGFEPVPGGPATLPTEAERTTADYTTRMLEAEAQIESMTDAPQKEGGLASMWDRMMMAGGNLTNWLRTEEGQLYQNAADQWIRAKLRKESGAAISDAEWISEYNTFFPKPGDSEEVRKQKRAARKKVMESMRTQAGRALPTLPATVPSEGTDDDPLGILR